MLPSYGSEIVGGYSPTDPFTFTHIVAVDAYMGLNGTAFIAVAEENCVRILVSNSSEELWNSTDPRYQRIGQFLNHQCISVLVCRCDTKCCA